MFRGSGGMRKQRKQRFSEMKHEEFCNSENMDVLHSITPVLPDFKEFIAASAEGRSEIKMESGAAIADNLFCCAAVSVTRMEVAGKSKFKRHTHKGHEWIIVFWGIIELKFDDGTTKTLRAKEYAYIKPDSAHVASCPVDCQFLAISIPAAPGWPR